jgi:hypothetical protein
MPKEQNGRGTELQARMAVPTRDSMSPGEKMAWLLDKALDCKREILTLPLPNPNDDSAEAHRMRALLLAAADSTIEQIIRLKANYLLQKASDDDAMEKIFEERMTAAKLEIERLNAGQNEYGYGKTPKPN